MTPTEIQGLVGASSTDAVLSLASVPLCSGQTVAMPVSISNGSGTQSIEFDLVYDASKMTATATSREPSRRILGVVKHLERTDPRRPRVGRTFPPALSGEVVEGDLPGESGLASGSSTAPYLENVKVNDESASGGSSTVTCTAPCKRGDVNGNGQVSAYDVLLILQAVVGAISLDSMQQCAADFNLNGA